MLIIGAGLAGLAAKKKLDAQGIHSIFVESSPDMGGHAKTADLIGHKFDQGPHILFGKDDELLDFAGAPASSSFNRTAVVGNHWNGTFLSQPAQMDFCHQPDEEVRNRVAQSILDAHKNGNPEDATNYREWLDATQGQAVRQEFTERYTRKYWRLPTDELGTDWVSGRIHAASAFQNEIIRRHKSDGTLGMLDLTKESYYLTTYTYSDAGFWGLFKGFHELEVDYNTKIVKVDLDRQIAYSDSQTIGYKKLISTIPLTRLVDISGLAKFKDLDPLKVTSFVCTNFVLRIPSGIQHDYQWLYLYDEAQPISRICFPSRFNDPQDSGDSITMQTESYFLQPSEEPPVQSAEEIISYLQREKILPADAEVLASTAEIHDFANIVPTPKRAEVAEALEHLFLSKDVLLAGRFGRWEYLWSLDAVRSGIKAADLAKRSIDEKKEQEC